MKVMMEMLGRNRFGERTSGQLWTSAGPSKATPLWMTCEVVSSMRLWRSCAQS